MTTDPSNGSRVPTSMAIAPIITKIRDQDLVGLINMKWQASSPDFILTRKTHLYSLPPVKMYRYIHGEHAKEKTCADMDSGIKTRWV